MSRGVIRSRDSNLQLVEGGQYLVEKVAVPPTEVMEVNVVSGG
jgi:hypothetical protein